MRGFRTFQLILWLSVFLVTVVVTARIHQSYVDRTVEAAVKEAVQGARATSIREELNLLVLQRRYDISTVRSDIDRIIRGIVRMKMADRLRDLSRTVSQDETEDAKTVILAEAKYLAPYVYRYADRETFLTFGDALHYVYLTPESAGLSPEYWVALAKAK